ncbi:MAG: DUF5749 family beta-barrel protein [Candidatus Methanoperedens sp.]|nr:hypothetical protein [Candidatus Methanoperedens sp.]MCZ7394266.1 hypothetical protein [Candidatus Methanoperedens sp.]
MAILNKISNFFTKKPELQGKNDNTSKAHGYVGKFVKQNSEDIGESIAVEDGRLIVKNSDNIMSIPLGVVVANTDNIVVGDFNREESLALGKEWFDRKDTLKFDEKGMLIK